jgi:transposase
MGGDRKSGAATAKSVAEAVEEEPDRTLRELCQWFLDRLGRRTSPSTVADALRRSGFRRRRKVLLAKERTSPKWMLRNAEYLAMAAAFDPSKLVFIDESGVQRGMLRTTAWRRPGSVVVGRTVRNRGTVTTVLGALSLKGVVAAMYGEGATTAEVFRAFVKECLVPALLPGAIVVMDNLGAHRAKGIVELIEAAGASVIFLPPYSPELNPIECTWAKVKGLIRTAAPQTLPQLHKALTAALSAVTPQDAAGWFRHTGYAPRLAA